MLRRLTACVTAAVDRRLRDFALDVAAAAIGALFAAISLGFGTYAAYVYLRAWEGPVFAALIICMAYGLLAISRRRACRLTRGAAASSLASPDDVESLLRSLAAAGAPMRLGRELSPLQVAALALIGGFKPFSIAVLPW